MTIPDYYVRMIQLPPAVRGVTLPNDDGTFSIYINSLLSDESRRSALEHELEHMARDHFYRSEESVALQEQEANGVPAEKTADGRSIRRYRGLRGLEAFLRRIGALGKPLS